MAQFIKLTLVGNREPYILNVDSINLIHRQPTKDYRVCHNELGVDCSGWFDTIIIEIDSKTQTVQVDATSEENRKLIDGLLENK